MKDLHTKISVQRVIDPQAVGTTGVGRTGKIIDTQGYGGVEFALAYGSITATNAVITPVVKEGDVTGTMTSVADADLIGLEVTAGVAAAATRTSAVSKNCTRRIGYKGNKRYVNVSISATVTAVPIISAVAILHSPVLAPTTNP